MTIFIGSGGYSRTSCPVFRINSPNPNPPMPAPMTMTESGLTARLREKTESSFCVSISALRMYMYARPFVTQIRDARDDQEARRHVSFPRRNVAASYRAVRIGCLSDSLAARVPEINHRVSRAEGLRNDLLVRITFNNCFAYSKATPCSHIPLVNSSRSTYRKINSV
jgi:hypothetical protein